MEKKPAFADPSNIPFAQRLACTVDEAVLATGIGRSRLYELMKKGDLEFTRNGNRRLVFVKSLLKKLELA